MLPTIKRILHQVDSAHDLFELLQTVLVAINETINAEICHIFLYDEEQKIYISSIPGALNIPPVTGIKIPSGKGLVSLIAQRSEPMNIEDACEHPHYYHEPLDGMAPVYHGFLGAPIIHRKQTLGVITVRKKEKKVFDSEDEAFLVTLCVQIAGTIAQAKMSGHFSALLKGNAFGQNNQNIMLKGISCVSGIAMGKTSVIYPKANLDAVPDQWIEDSDEELCGFQEALLICRKEISHLRERLTQTLPPKELALFDAYLSMLDDQHLVDEIQAIIKTGLSAQTALRRVIKAHGHYFSLMDDPYLREREADLRSLGQRLLACLQTRQQTLKTYPFNTILVGEEISAADLAEVPNGRLAGIVSGQGSVNSHVAILARALGIPAVLGVEGLPLADLDKQDIIVDGHIGQVFVAVSDKLWKQYADLQVEEAQLKANLLYLRDLPAETVDGHSLSLRVNIGLTINRGSSLRLNAEGVGLFRSEVAFLGRDRFPTEEEQRVIYRQLLTAFSPRPVVIRTLDIGGDKVLPYFGVEENNPALGWRGIRITLDHPEVFLVQMRAMLRASLGLDNLQVMFPMVSVSAELDEAKALVLRAYNELREEGLSISFPSIGVMIEVPAAIYQLPALLSRVDFISVGSNDLIQYLLAVDRDNAYVAHLYQSLHPAVLHVLYHIAQEAKKAGKFISICGEMASDQLAVPLLVAMGYDCLSTHSANLLHVKSIIRRLDFKEAQHILHTALKMECAEKIKRLIQETYYTTEV